MFADDFVGVTECGELLPRLRDDVHSYWYRGLEMLFTLIVGSEDKVSKSAIMTFGKDFVEDNWEWGKQDLARYQSVLTWGVIFQIVVHGMCILLTLGIYAQRRLR